MAGPIIFPETKREIVPVPNKKPVTITGLPRLDETVANIATASSQAQDKLADILQRGKALNVEKIAQATEDQIQAEDLSASIQISEDTARIEREKIAGNVATSIEALDKANRLNPFVAFARTLIGDKSANRRILTEELNSDVTLFRVFNRVDQARRQGIVTAAGLLESENIAEARVLAARQAGLDVETQALLIGFQTLNTTLQAQARVIQIKQEERTALRTAREDVLSQLDLPEALAFAEDAKFAGGATLINGIEIPLSELNNVILSRRRTKADLRAIQLANANKEFENADVFEIRMLEDLTDGQLEKLGRDKRQIVDESGQVIHTVSANNFQTELSRRLEITKIIAERRATQTSEVAAVNARLEGLIDLTSNLQKHATAEFGNRLPPKLKQEIAKITAQVSALPTEEDGPLSPAQTAAISKELDLATEKLDVSVDSLVKEFAAGDKQLAPLFKAFLLGGPANVRDSGIALFKQSLGALPSTVLNDPALAAGFNRMRSVIATELQKTLGVESPAFNALDDLDTKRSAMLSMATRILDAATGQIKVEHEGLIIKGLDAFYAGFKQEAADRAIQSVVPLAAQSGHDIGILPPGTIATALRSAEIQTETLQPEEGQSQAEFANKKALGEIAFFMRTLDLMNPGTRFSEQFSSVADAFIDFMGSDKFFEGIAKSEESRADGSFLGFLAQGSAIQGRFISDINLLQRLYGQELANSRSKMLGETVTRARLYGGGNNRAETIITAAAEGLSTESIERFIEFVETPLQLGLSQQTSTPASMQVENRILHEKFDNPEMESIRKQIAKNWIETAQRLDVAMARLESSRLKLNR